MRSLARSARPTTSNTSQAGTQRLAVEILKLPKNCGFSMADRSGYNAMSCGTSPISDLRAGVTSSPSRGHGAFISPQQSGDHGDRGRLACAVGTQQSVGLAGSDRERDLVDGGVLTESSYQLLDLQDRAIHGFNLRPGLSGVRRTGVSWVRTLEIGTYVGDPRACNSNGRALVQRTYITPTPAPGRAADPQA